MTKGAKRFRSVLCGLLSFLLSVSLVLLCILGTLKLTALNPAYTSYVCVHSGYAQSVWEEMKEEFVSYGAACNIDESFFDGVFENIITPQLITEYTKSSVEGFYKNSPSDKTSDEQIKAQLLEALKSYAEEKGFVINDALVENLEVISDEMNSMYLVYADMFNTSYFNTASNMLTRYMPLLKWAVLGIAVFALLAIIVIRLFFKKAKNYLRYYIYSASGAALMLAIAPAAALILKIASKINIVNASLYYLATGFINGFLIALLAVAAVMAVITVILTLIRASAVRKNK